MDCNVQLGGTRYGVARDSHGYEYVVERVPSDTVGSYGAVLGSTPRGSGDAPPAGFLDSLGVGQSGRDSGGNDASAEPEPGVRTLWIDYDEQGVRVKSWSQACKEMTANTFSDSPIPGQYSMLFLAKHMRDYGDHPRGWLREFCHDRGIAKTDRVYHELDVLMWIMDRGACYDQLNLASLASFETVARRVQAIIDAYAEAGKPPNWKLAKHYAGGGSAAEGVDPSLRDMVLRRSRLEREALAMHANVVAAGATDVLGHPWHEGGGGGEVVEGKGAGKTGGKTGGKRGGRARGRGLSASG